MNWKSKNRYEKVFFELTRIKFIVIVISILEGFVDKILIQ